MSGLCPHCAEAHRSGRAHPPGLCRVPACSRRGRLLVPPGHSHHQLVYLFVQPFRSSRFVSNQTLHEHRVDLRHDLMRVAAWTVPRRTDVGSDTGRRFCEQAATGGDVIARAPRDAQRTATRAMRCARRTARARPRAGPQAAGGSRRSERSSSVRPRHQELRRASPAPRARASGSPADVRKATSAAPIGSSTTLCCDAPMASSKAR